MSIHTTLKQKSTNEDVFPDIEAQNIPDGAIITIKIADGAVITAKIANNAITQYKIADGAVITAKIVDGAITTQKLATWAVTTAKINDGAVTIEKMTLNDNDIPSAKVAVNAGAIVSNLPTNLADLRTFFINYFTNSRFLRFYVYKNDVYENLEISAIEETGDIYYRLGSSPSASIGSDADALSFANDYEGFLYVVTL